MFLSRHVFSKELTGQDDHNEFAMCMSALGAAIDNACPNRKDTIPAAAEGRQRQPDSLAVRAVSGRLARLELMGQI
ncbi:hypothetical protein [Bradyrhizobium sp. BR 1432]|uniref:hypothetical protein n=1 Tax=Bradyrhizobium sp. BR 1432 TaxID=3447966 RepID=UPI003EE5DCAB